jgi:hypothetical protein
MIFNSIAVAAAAAMSFAVANAAQASSWGAYQNGTYAYLGPSGTPVGQAIGAVNMRTCARPSCDRILIVPNGARLVIIGTARSWYHVSYGDRQGFVAARYVSTQAVAAISPRTVTYGSTVLAPATVTYAGTAFPQGYEHIAYGRHPTAIQPVRTAAAFAVPATVPIQYESRFASTRTVTLASAPAAVASTIGPLPPLPPLGPTFGYCAMPVWDDQNQAWFDGCRWGYNNGWYVAPPLVTRF